MRIVALLFAVLVVLLIGLLVAVKPIRRHRSSVPAAAPGLRVSFPRPGQAVAILPVKAGVSSAAGARLVDELAMSVLESFEDAHDVEVRTSDGELLGTRRRSCPKEVPASHSALPPEQGSRPPAAPLILRRPSAGEASARVDLVPRSLADRLELPSHLHAGLADPDDPVDIVEGLLRAAGHDPDRTGNLLRLDDHALVVLRVPVGSMVPREDLNRAYVQFRDSGSSRGLVVAAGYFASREIARRQAIDPNLRHAGFRDLQRMADTAAAGVDPLDFALPPRATRDTG